MLSTHPAPPSGHHIRVSQSLWFEMKRYPEGFVLQPDFLTPDDEDRAISVIERLNERLGYAQEQAAE